MVQPAGRLRRTLRRPAVAMALLITLLLVLVAAWAPRAGTFLVEADPLVKSDVIFVLAGTRAERMLEGVDLYKAGYAPVVLLSPGLIESAELELRAKGVRFPTDSELARDVMVQLGVPASAIVAPPAPVDNTADEAILLRRVAAERGWQSAIVVTSKYHSRRSGFAFRRALRNSGVRVLVQPSKYDNSDPQHWWRRRSDVRYVTSELQKLLAYRLGVAE